MSWAALPCGPSAPSTRHRRPLPHSARCTIRRPRTAAGRSQWSCTSAQQIHVAADALGVKDLAREHLYVHPLVPVRREPPLERSAVYRARGIKQGYGLENLLQIVATALLAPWSTLHSDHVQLCFAGQAKLSRSFDPTWNTRLPWPGPR